MLRAATPGRRGLEPGERSSLRGLSRCRAAPFYLGWRVCAPSAGRASVCGSGPSLFLECLWVGVSAYGVAVSMHSPWLLWAGVFLRCQLRRAGRPSPRAVFPPDAQPSTRRISRPEPPQCLVRRFPAALLQRVWKSLFLSRCTRGGQRRRRLGRWWALFDQERSGVGPGLAAQ